MSARHLPPFKDAARLAGEARRMRRLAAEAAAMPGNGRLARRFQAHARELEEELRTYAECILAGWTALDTRVILHFEGGPAWPSINPPRDVTPAERLAWRLSATGARREWDPTWPLTERRS